MVRTKVKKLKKSSKTEQKTQQWRLKQRKRKLSLVVYDNILHRLFTMLKNTSTISKNKLLLESKRTSREAFINKNEFSFMKSMITMNVLMRSQYFFVGTLCLTEQKKTLSRNDGFELCDKLV